MMKKKLLRRIFALGLCLLSLLGSLAGAEEEIVGWEPVEVYDFSGKQVRSYESETLIYSVERFRIDGVRCFLSKIWVREPARQIRKATAEWRKNIQLPAKMARQIEKPALVINGSGYVSPTYPWIPEDYPGESSDYYYTPLGSLTVTHGEVFRQLEGVPYYGLTLERDGLHMSMGEDNGAVLARNPTETWSFYIQCPMLLNNEDVLPEDWAFADRDARRTVIARVNMNNYLILTVTNDGKAGLSLRRISRFFRKYFRTEWVYNLDGGPSSALLCRRKGKKKLVALMGGKAKDADIMAFVE